MKGIPDSVSNDFQNFLFCDVKSPTERMPLLDQPKFAQFSHDPVVVGGVGGSGTRLVNAILIKLGCFMGSDLNASLDNLTFTFLFKHGSVLDCSENDFTRVLEIFLSKTLLGAATNDEVEFATRFALRHQPASTSEDWIRKRISFLNKVSEPAPPGQWGWKEPNTHLILDQLITAVPDLRYIHVMRNGLDMAYSENQNQLRRWGPLVFGKMPRIDPAHSLKYWCWVHRRFVELSQINSRNLYLLNFDRLCDEPVTTLRSLLQFLGWEPDQALFEEALALVNRPSSRDRFQHHTSSDFDPQDIAYVKKLGFLVWD